MLYQVTFGLKKWLKQGGLFYKSIELFFLV